MLNIHAGRNRTLSNNWQLAVPCIAMVASVVCSSTCAHMRLDNDFDPGNRDGGD